MVEMSTSGSGEGPGEVTPRGYSTSVSLAAGARLPGRLGTGLGLVVDFRKR